MVALVSRCIQSLAAFHDDADSALGGSKKVAFCLITTYRRRARRPTHFDSKGKCFSPVVGHCDHKQFGNN